MKLVMTRERGPDGDDVVRFEGEVTGIDMMRLSLTEVEQRVLQLCGDSEIPADWLIGLEMLFRKHHEAQQAPAVPVHNEHPSLN